MKLTESYENIYQLIPTKIDKSVILTKEMFNITTKKVIDENIVIKKLNRTYNSYGEIFLDCLVIFVNRKNIRCLGLCILDAILHNKKSISIELTNKYSDIKIIEIEIIHNNKKHRGIYLEPKSFKYYASLIDSYDFKYNYQQNKENKIFTALCHKDKFITNYEQYKNRDIFKGFGTVEASAKLAELFLDMGLEENNISEFHFENINGK